VSAGREEIVRLCRSVVPFGAAFITLSVFYKIDVLLLQHWRVAHDVGLYTAAYKFVDIYQALVLVGIAALYPRLARSAPDPDRATATRWGGTRVTEMALLIAVPIAGILHLAARPAMLILFGREYAEAARALGWLALGLPPLALNLLASYLLGATARIGWLALAYAGAIVVKVSIDAVLIPQLGTEGAAIGMAAAETLLACCTLVALRVHAHVVPGARVIAGAFGALVLLVGARALPGSDTLLVGCAFIAAVVVLYGALGLLRSAAHQLHVGLPRGPVAEPR
jgi:O-antigen/teichoic acid export membrane protein